ncbi:MAG: peptidoglycan DD-metalloendopeptidase family protein [Firmicutes bacterium]|nr:peptidoglycan DD-metalloendopeptidase family protein [Bacillota bacterium]
MRVCKSMLILLVLIALFTVLNISLAMASQQRYDLSNRIEKIQEQIASDEKYLETATAEYKKSLTQVQSLDLKIDTCNSKLKYVQVKLDSLKNNTGKDKFYSYSFRSYNLLSALVFSSSLNDFLTKLGAFGHILNRNIKTADELKTLKYKLLSHRSNLLTLREDKVRELADAQQRYNEINNALVSRKDILVSINFNARSSRLRFDNRNAPAKPSLRYNYASRGSNRGGFVFPVAGAHTYVDSWGNARSGGRRHQGTDIMAARGTPAVACTSGVIGKATPFSRGIGGITIWLVGDDGNAYYYAHLDCIEPSIRPGVRVGAGQVIGKVGSTGNAPESAPHLHFEFHPQGERAVNPYPLLKSVDK